MSTSRSDPGAREQSEREPKREPAVEIRPLDTVRDPTDDRIAVFDPNGSPDSWLTADNWLLSDLEGWR